MIYDAVLKQALPPFAPVDTGPDRFQVIVRFTQSVPGMTVAAEASGLGGRVEKLLLSETSALSAGGSVYVMSFPDTPARDALVASLARRPGVELAEIDQTVSAALASADPYYSNGSLWGMYGPTGDGIGASSNIYGSRADVAWADSTVSADGKVGSAATVVGVLDSGIDALHPDLFLNIWLNAAEIPAGLASDSDGDGVVTMRDLNVKTLGTWVNAVSDVNGNGYIDADDILKIPAWADGIDQDGNGYVDDLFGWDFIGNDNRPFEAYTGAFLPLPLTANSYHGTHVSGTIGALSNSIGVAGVVWDVQIIPLRFLNSQGTGQTSDAIEALTYYTAMGLANPDLDFVGTNNSWGGGAFSQFLAEAIKTAGDHGQLFFAAAGNNSNNNDASPHWPGSYSINSVFEGVTYDPIVSVASIDANGARSSFSNYGPNSVDLGAPGGAINSTFAGPVYFQPSGYTYFSLNGTSMATPHVTGAAALIASEFPGLHPADLRAVLLNGTSSTASLAGLVATSGRLNIAGAITLVGPAPVVTLGDTALSLADASTTITIAFGRAVTGFSAQDISVSNGHGTISGLTSSNNATWTATFTPANVETDVAQIFVGNRFTDTEGRPGRSDESAQFSIDRIAPTTQVVAITATQATSGVAISGSLDFSLSSDDRLAVYRDGSYLGDAAVAGATWSFTDTATLTDGSYAYTARPIDAAGNAGALSGTANWEVGAPPPPLADAPLDFDADGGTDLLFQRLTTGVSYVLDGDGGYLQNFYTQALGGIEAVGDFDGDGAYDILVRGADNVFRSFAGIDNTQVNYGNRVGDTLLAVADFDNDGGDDILFQRNSTGVTYVLDGSGGYQQNFFTRPLGGIEAVGDFDGDGASDILVREAGDIYTIVGGIDGAVTNIGSLASYVVLAVADFDENGTDDVLFQQLSTGVIVIYNGSGGPQQFFGTQPLNGLEAVGDLNGDGAVDIVIRGSNDVIYSLQGGNGQQVNYGNRANDTLLAVADFDGDGGDDLLFQRNTSGVTFVIDGEGGLQQSFQTQPLGGVEAVGDLDGDGKADILVRGADNVFRSYGGGDGAQTNYGGRANDALLTVDNLLGTEPLAGNGIIA